MDFALVMNTVLDLLAHPDPRGQRWYVADTPPGPVNGEPPVRAFVLNTMQGITDLDDREVEALVALAAAGFQVFRFPEFVSATWTAE